MASEVHVNTCAHLDINNMDIIYLSITCTHYTVLYLGYIQHGLAEYLYKNSVFSFWRSGFGTWTQLEKIDSLFYSLLNLRMRKPLFRFLHFQISSSSCVSGSNHSEKKKKERRKKKNDRVQPGQKE